MKLTKEDGYFKTYGIFFAHSFEKQADISNLTSEDEEYINPVHKFIDNIETKFENFCDWLRGVLE